MRRKFLARMFGAAVLGTMVQVGCNLQGAGQEITDILQTNVVTTAGDVAQVIGATLAENAIN